MAWLPGSAANASDGKMLRSPNGNSLFVNGAFYVLNAPAAALANSTTTTSLFQNDPWSSTPATTPIVVSMGSPPYQLYPGSTRILPPMSLTQGTMFNFDFFGNISNTSTPNLQVQLGLIGPGTSTTFTVLADTTAVSMTNESGTVFFHLNGGFSTQVYSTSGTINGFVYYEYGPTGIAVASPVKVTTAFDTTQQYTIDVRATWGTANSSNSVQLLYGAIEVIG